jgi:hypothetical protein
MEGDRPHVVAAAAVPGQEDVRGVFGAGHFHPALGEVGIEIAAVGQAPGDGDLAAFVGDVVEALAHPGLERGDVLDQVAVLPARPGDGDVLAAHLDRLALSTWMAQSGGRRRAAPPR